MRILIPLILGGLLWACQNNSSDRDPDSKAPTSKNEKLQNGSEATKTQESYHEPVETVIVGRKGHAQMGTLSGYTVTIDRVPMLTANYHEIKVYDSLGTSISSMRILAFYAAVDSCDALRQNSTCTFTRDRLVITEADAVEQCSHYCDGLDFEACKKQKRAEDDPYKMVGVNTDTDSKTFLAVTEDGKLEVQRDEYQEVVQKTCNGLSILDDLPKKQLRLLRSFVLAKHGYAFRAADLKAHFEQYDWYKPESWNVDNKLTDYEKELVKYIRGLERK